MNMVSRNEYLQTLVKEQWYLLLNKKVKSKILDEYCKNTGQNRKYVIRKIRNWSYTLKPKRKRKVFYDKEVVQALIRCYEIFDNPCWQRLQPLLTTEVSNLRKLGELKCSDEIQEKLLKIWARTIDNKLVEHKEREKIKRKYHKKVHSLLYKKVVVKVFHEQDRSTLWNIQVDLVEHCWNSAAWNYIYTVSTTDISTWWWEWVAVLNKWQLAVQKWIDEAKNRYPFNWKDLHIDNWTEFMNNHLYNYTIEKWITFSRSRPYKKNDNCLVEQKNWTHVRKQVGYLRYDSDWELSILNSLYQNEMRLFKNFFQPVMKLVSKKRIWWKIYKKYDIPKTPYQRVLESDEVDEKRKLELKKIYNSLNPAKLKNNIDKKLNFLWIVYQNKQRTREITKTKKKMQPSLVTFKTAEQKAFGLHS